MKTDYELLKKCGYDFNGDEEKLHNRMDELINYLCWHNKNYTKKQYYLIMELKDIIKCTEVSE